MALFCVDEDVSAQVADALNVRGHDAVAITRDAALRGQNDAVILLFAIQHERVLITHNFTDFVLLHRVCVYWPLQIHHKGILLVPHKFHLPATLVADHVEDLLSDRNSIDRELYALEREVGATYRWAQRR